MLTDAGQTLYEECRPLLAGLEEAVERASAGQDELAGTLRISTTVDHASLSLAPALAGFARQHPHLAIDLRTSDRVVDLIDEGIDLTIRLGWLRDSSHRAVKLGQFEQYLVAAPGYLRRAGMPAAPQDLEAHAWVALTLLPAPLTWTFAAADGQAATVHVGARLRVDSPTVLRTLLEQDAGISVLDQFNAQLGMASGRLVRVLPAWSLPAGGIYAVYPPAKQVPAKVRSFIDYYRGYLDQARVRARS